MPTKVSFTPEAGDEIEQGYMWYEERRCGLGEEFLSCVDAAVQRISRHPKLNPVAFENYRRILIRKFPYSIIYEIDGNEVIVYAVFHASQDPDKLRNRLS